LKKSKREHIETYIFGPDLLSKEQKIVIEKWLDSDAELQAIAQWYSDFKKEIQFVEKGKSKVRPKLPKIHLFPSTTPKRKKHTFTLAAKTSAVKKRKAGFYTLRTFISEENKVLVRVLRDDDSGMVQIHAISENIESDDIAMLRVPGINDLMISEPGGIFFLKLDHLSDDEVTNWESCTLFLSMDRADLLMNRETGNIYLDTHRTDKEKLSISIAEEGLCIKVSIKTEQDYRINKVVVSDGEKGYLLLTENETVEIPRSVIKNRLTSLFFFN